MNIIFFDLMGVAVPDVPSGSAKVMKNLYTSTADISANISFEDFYQRYQQFMKGQITNKEMWAGIPDSTQIQKQYLDSYQFNPNLEAVISELRSQSYLTALLSNHPDSWVKYLWQFRGLDKFFTREFNSGAYHLTKSSPDFYRLAAKGMRAEPDQCSLVDDQTKNLIVAKEVGFKTILFTKAPDPNGSFQPDHSVQSLAELPNLL